MSQVYRVTLEGNVTKTIHVDDMMRIRVELSDILTKEEMDTILKNVLKKEGWVEEDGVFHEKDSEDSTIWDVENGEVVTKVGLKREVSIDVTGTGSSESTTSARTNADSALKRELDKASEEIEKIKRSEQKALAEKLTKSESERTAKINKVLQKVYTEALVAKAGQLGSVKSVETEDNGDAHSVTIRVEA